MEQKHIIASAVVLGLIIVGMFTFAYLKKSELESPEPTVTVTEDPSSPYGHITSIDAKHFFIGGTHTVAGEILMPTPCDLLEWDTRIMESAPEQVIIDFTVINHTETCAQVMTPQRFKVSFDASSEAVIRATLAGREVILNLVPALDGETPEDFELFIKG
jgi:hypothetical protein